MAEIVCVGDLLVDFVPTVTGTGLVDAPAFAKAPGGAAANVAVGLARLGIGSVFMGKVGDDPFGRFLADTLAKDGIDVSGLRFETRARTALAFVSLRADGEREFLFYRHPSADMLFVPEEVDTGAIERAALLHFDSLSLTSEKPRSAALFAADTALRAGKLVSYDANLRLPLWPDAASAKAGILEGLAKAHIVKLSDDELEFLTGRREPEAARQLWHDRLRLLCVTRGASGCTWLSATAQAHVPSFPVRAVDTTGAGDGFMAGLLAGLVRDPDAIEDPTKLTAICRFANAVGALATLERGAIPALPTRAAVEAFLARHGDAAPAA